MPGDFDWDQIGWNLLQCGIAFALAFPVGWDRESSRSPGVRTFPLVAVASCGFMLLGFEIAGDSADARARVLQGVITGIGFLGGGAIIKSGANIRGTATAAAIWTTAAIGAAVAANVFEIAIILSVVTFVILRWLKELKPVSHRQGHADDPERTDES